MAKKPKQRSSGPGGGRSARATAEIRRMPPSARRAAPAAEPVVFPSVPTIVENAARAAVATNGDNRILHWNAAAVELFGFTAEEVIGRNLQRVIQARDVHDNRLSADHDAFHEMIRIGEAPQSFELAIITSTGKMRRVAVSIVVVIGPKATEYNLIYLMTPINRRRRTDEAIDRLLAQSNVPGVVVPGANQATSADQRGTSRPPHLTRRQMDVLLLLAEGKTSQEIAGELEISVHTVRTHVQGVLRTFGCANCVEAVSRALHERLI